MSDKTVIGLSRLMTLRQQVDKVARNVANQTTPGFKSEGLQFREYLTKSKEADETPSQPMRSLVAVVGFTDFSAGSLKATGNPMDAAIVGEGFFVVRTLAGERFTRNGSFTIDAEGRLVTLRGDPVMTPSGELRIPQREGAISIGPDGSVATAKGTIGRLRVVRFSDLRSLRAEGGFFSSDTRPVEIPAAETRLATGALENSNVKAVQEMSKLMAASRAYHQVANVILHEGDKNELRKLAGEDLYGK